MSSLYRCIWFMRIKMIDWSTNYHAKAKYIKTKLSSYRGTNLTTAWFQWGLEKQGTFQTSIYGFWLPCGTFKLFMKLLWVFICFYILFHSDKTYVGMIILIFQQKRDMTDKISDSGYQNQNNKDDSKIYHSKHT